MSHLSKVSMAMKDLATLEAAAKALGLVLDTTIKTMRGSYITVNNCVGVLHAPGEINHNNMAGVVKNAQGDYEIQLDYFHNSISKNIGNNGEKLTKSYSEILTETEMVNSGYLMAEKSIDQKTGETVMVFHEL